MELNAKKMQVGQPLPTAPGVSAKQPGRVLQMAAGPSPAVAAANQEDAAEAWKAFLVFSYAVAAYKAAADDVKAKLQAVKDAAASSKFAYATALEQVEAAKKAVQAAKKDVAAADAVYVQVSVSGNPAFEAKKAKQKAAAEALSKAQSELMQAELKASGLSPAAFAATVGALEKILSAREADAKTAHSEMSKAGMALHDANAKIGPDFLKYWDVVKMAGFKVHTTKPQFAVPHAIGELRFLAWLGLEKSKQAKNLEDKIKQLAQDVQTKTMGQTQHAKKVADLKASGASAEEIAAAEAELIAMTQDAANKRGDTVAARKDAKQKRGESQATLDALDAASKETGLSAGAEAGARVDEAQGNLQQTGDVITAAGDVVIAAGETLQTNAEGAGVTLPPAVVGQIEQNSNDTGQVKPSILPWILAAVGVALALK